METSCEFGIEPSDSMKYWETIEWPNIPKFTNASLECYYV
jgi:hypothetical protein